MSYKQKKQPNDYYDNYSNKYKGGFWGGLLWALLFGAINELVMAITGTSGEGGAIKMMNALGGGLEVFASGLADFADKPFDEAMSDMWSGIKEALIPDWMQDTWETTNKKLDELVGAIASLNPFGEAAQKRRANIAAVGSFSQFIASIPNMLIV